MASWPPHGAYAELLFVTLLVGVLDVESGDLSLVNAGHDGPWRIALDGRLEHIVCPLDAGGPPLCVIDDFAYVAQQVRLLPGDSLSLITDGISEAMDAAGEAYGSERLVRVLKRLQLARRPPMWCSGCRTTSPILSASPKRPMT